MATTTEITGIITTMTDISGLQKLALWLSPGFPISAYAYSHGVEAAIADNHIHDAASAQGWISDLLRHGAGRNDAILLAHAWRGDDVTDLALALTGAAERRRETTEQGSAFARIISMTEAPLPAAPYPIAVGQAAARAGAALPETIALFLQAFAGTLVTACVKSVPLGQTQGQVILTALLPLIRELAAQAETASLDDLGGACLRGDLSAIRHETLEPRIYRT